MKLIVLAVVSIAVFRASCRERPNGREFNDVGHHLSDGSNLPEDSDFSYGTNHYYSSEITNGPKDEATTVEPETFSYGPVDGVSSTDVDMAFSTIEFGPELLKAGFHNYDSSDVDHQLKEDGTLHKVRKLRGGSKCKSDIMCSLLGGSCISNSTYCTGRELPSLCGGAKCKCCINVNLEVKMHDVETELQSMVVNLSLANSHLNAKLESMKNIMISSNSSQAAVNSNLDLKINSIMSTNSNITNKLDSIRMHQGCPEGLFLYTPTNQCFRFLMDSKRSYDSAKTACNESGLQLAHPRDSLSLRNYLVEKYVLTTGTWVGGRGDGSSIRWERTGQAITANLPLWWSSSPGSYVSTGHCLGMLTHEEWWKRQSSASYWCASCTDKMYTLCELDME